MAAEDDMRVRRLGGMEKIPHAPVAVLGVHQIHSLALGSAVPVGALNQSHLLTATAYLAHQETL
jgi:hypothetical protein